MYIYAADTYCDPCAEQIMADLDANGKRPPDMDPDNECTWDSDDWPKGPFRPCEDHDEGPDHCGSCAEIIDA